MYVMLRMEVRGGFSCNVSRSNVHFVLVVVPSNPLSFSSLVSRV